MVKSATESGGDTEMPTADDVEDYLRSHPDFLAEHPDLLSVLTPPARLSGETVVDMQTIILDRVKGEVARLKDTQGALIAASRSNLATQTQVHAAVLAMLEATSFDHLLHIVTADFAELLDVDVVTLSLESAVPPRMSSGNFYILPKGSVDRLLGPMREVLLRPDAEPSPAIFGPATDLVRSDALVRLRFSDATPAGLLAIGSRQEEKYHSGQGTELLQFLAQAVQRCMKHWMEHDDIQAPAPA